MKRIIISVFTTIALILSGYYLPVFGIIGMLLCPLPLALLGNLEGHRRMSLAELMTEITLFIMVSPLMALYFLIGCAGLSSSIFLLSREEFRKTSRYTGAESFLICAGVSLSLKIITILIFWFFTGRNILLPEVPQLHAMMKYSDSPEVYIALRAAMSLLPYMLPSIIVIYVSCEVYLNYTLCYNIIRRYFPDVKNYPPELPLFIHWKFPVSLLLVSVISLIAGYITDREEIYIISVFILNLQIVLNILMLIQGVSLIYWLMEGYKLRRLTRITISIILIIPFFWSWLIILGMSEIGLNLRSKIRKGGY